MVKEKIVETNRKTVNRILIDFDVNNNDLGPVMYHFGLSHYL